MAALAAHARENEPVLAAGNRTLSLELPEAAFSQPGATLSVDLDGYDVSTFSTVQGRTLAIDLDVPLAMGPHSVAVLLFLPNGETEVLLDQTVDAPAIPGGDVSLNTALQTSYRANERPGTRFEAVDRNVNTGSLTLAGRRTADRWRLESGIEAIYDTTEASADQTWLLPSYAASATYLGSAVESSAAAGRIDIAREDLLFSSFKRRGAAARTAATSGRFAAQVFSVASAPRNGFDGDYFAPGDADDRSTGVTASLALVPDRLQVGGSFVDGRSRYGGAGFNVDDDIIYGGESWNVTIDSRWMDDSVRLSFERAESEFDADGLGIGLPASKDDASQARLRLSSAGGLGAGPFSYWSADFVHKRVGRDFYSVGNLFQAGNIEVSSADFHGALDSVSVELALSRQRTNEDGDDLLPTQTTKRAGIDVSYSPALLAADNPLWSTLGAPSFTGWLYRSDSSQPAADALLAGFDLDNRTREAGLAVAFSRETLTWSAEVGVIDYDDSSDPVVEGGYLIYEPPSDSRNVQVSVQASWAPSARATLDAYLQRNDFEETDFDDEYRSTSLGMSGTFLLTPEALSLHVSASRELERSRLADPLAWPQHLRSHFAATRLNWRVAQANDRNPGLSVYLKGAYARSEDLAFLEDDEMWSVHLGAEISWARGR